MSKTSVYADALANAERELESLLSTRANIDAKISLLKNTVESLKAQIQAERDINSTEAVLSSLGIAFEESTGISDAIRDILGISKVPLTAPQIRDALVARGYDTTQYASILTVIHNTAKRLEKQGELSTVQDAVGNFIGWVRTRAAGGQTTTLGEIVRHYRPTVGQRVARGMRAAREKKD